jgi:hypothetical protein
MLGIADRVELFEHSPLLQACPKLFIVVEEEVPAEKLFMAFNEEDILRNYLDSNLPTNCCIDAPFSTNLRYLGQMKDKSDVYS